MTTYRILFRPTLLLLLCLHAIGVARAADWQTLRKANGPQALQQYDATSQTRKDDIVTVWSKTSYTQDFEIPDAPPLRARVILSLINLNCSTRMETTKRILYLQDDDPQNKLIERGPLDTTEIVPDSPKELLFNKLCRKKK